MRFSLSESPMTSKMTPSRKYPFGNVFHNLTVQGKKCSSHDWRKTEPLCIDLQTHHTNDKVLRCPDYGLQVHSSPIGFPFKIPINHSLINILKIINLTSDSQYLAW